VVTGKPNTRSLKLKLPVLELNETWQPAFGEIMVSTPGTPATNFFRGQSIEVSGVIAPPSPPLAEGLLIIGIICKRAGFITNSKCSPPMTGNCARQSCRTLPCPIDFLTWAKQTLALGLPVEDEPLRLLWAMTLGWRTAFQRRYQRPVPPGRNHAPFRN